MKTVFKSSFAKDLKSINSKAVRNAVAQLIERVETAQDLRAIPGVKKLQATGNYYRIKLGDHRIGIGRVQGRDHLRSVPESQGYLPLFPMAVQGSSVTVLMHRREESSWGQNAENNVKLAQKPNPGGLHEGTLLYRTRRA